MTERKVLNKYYPPDFDPRLLPKLRLPKNRQYVIRTMAPFNMQCNTCGEYIYKGKKFNARKETVQNETYLGLEIYRFYIRCPRCLAEITFKTDLEHCDYAEEHGAKRLFEAQRIVEEAVKKEADEEERDKTDPMRMLEKRTKMSRFEMDALARLEELRELNQRQAKVDYSSMLGKFVESEEAALQRQDAEDDAFVRSLFGIEDGKKIKRILDEEEGELDSLPCSSSSNSSSSSATKKSKAEPVQSTGVASSSAKPDAAQISSTKPVSKQKQLLAGLVRKKPEPPPETPLGSTQSSSGSVTATSAPKTSLLSLNDYGTGSSSEEDS